MVGSLAFAQTITMTEGGIQRTNSFRTSSENPLWISRADCLNNDAFNFPLVYSGYASGDSLEVWVAGNDGQCNVDDDRTGAAPKCWKVLAIDPKGNGTTLEVPVRAIVSEDKDGELNGNYTEAVCDSAESATNTISRPINVYFMFINDGVYKAGYVWETHMDLAGPNAPTDVSVGVGDTLLVLEWDDNGDEDLVSYKFYCDPPPGEEGVDTGGGALPGPDASSDATTAFAADVVVPALDASADGEADAPEEAEAGGEAVDAETGVTADADAVESGSTTPTGPSAACETATLYLGADPPKDSKYLCGTGTGTSGKVTGLKNGVKYSIAIAGVDSVGNVGKLSKVNCDSPTIVNDFYRVYRDAGGKAGGGFCAASGGVGHGAGLSGLLLIAVAGLGGTIRRRRSA